MGTYIAKRTLLFIPTMLLVTVLVFSILRIVPGDPALLILGGEEGDDTFTQEQLDALRAKLGTDKPIYIQYTKWVANMFRGDFRISYFYEGDKVVDDIKGRLPVTLELGLMSLTLASIVAIPMGVISTIKQDTPGDYVTRVITIAGIALPNFWVAVMTIFFLVLIFNWAPPWRMFLRGRTLGSISNSSSSRPLPWALPIWPSSPASPAPPCWRCSTRTTSARPVPRG